MSNAKEYHVSRQLKQLLPGVDLVPSVDLPQVGALGAQHRLREGLDVMVIAH